MVRTSAAIVALSLCSACTEDMGGIEGLEMVDAGEGSDMGSSADGGPSEYDPFALRPDTSEGLTNVSADLVQLLEQGRLQTACDEYEQDPQDRAKRLLCGKYMFFYEDFGTVGVPALLVDFLVENFPQEVGLGFERMGMVADPWSDQDRPLGLAPAEPNGSVETLAYTCAACHFGALPDGRFAVGMPNLRYEYGAQVLAISLVPGSAVPGFDPGDHHPAALAKVQPMIARLRDNPLLRLRLAVNLIPLLGQAQPTLTREEEGQYASWPAGSMDFLIAPLPLDDGVHTVSKIIDLWDLPSAEEIEELGMPHALLAWTGSAPNLDRFLAGFVAIGDGAQDLWTPERLAPLKEYIESLRSPKNLSPPTESLVREGLALFRRDCVACHDGPRGGGRRTFTFAEMGTDNALSQWGRPDADGTYCCGLGTGSMDEASAGVKAPRLSGLWAKPRLLHNGAVEGLEALFCLNGPRPVLDAQALSAEGHEDLCVGYSAAEKGQLMAFLRTL